MLIVKKKAESFQFNQEDLADSVKAKIKIKLKK